MEGGRVQRGMERLPAIALLGAGLIVAAVIVSELKTKGKVVAAAEAVERDAQQ